MNHEQLYNRALANQRQHHAEIKMLQGMISIWAMGRQMKLASVIGITLNPNLSGQEVIKLIGKLSDLESRDVSESDNNKGE